jgi:DNA repair photolyase
MESDYIKGRGAQINPPNPYLNREQVSMHPEGLDEPLLLEGPPTEIFYESPKQVVNKVDSPDIGLAWSINPYQGCEHGCLYCYARNSHQYWGFSAGLDFETKIVVKQNAPALLERHLLRKHHQVVPIMLSGNTDCYQPLERKLGITRKLLEVMDRYRHPVGIITKNALITRDIDILKSLAEKNLVHVYFSINTLQEDLRQRLEPRTASSFKRLKAMETLSEAGIPTGLMNAPVIPGLNHHEIPAIVRSAADAGARKAGYTVVRLNGSIGEVFHDWLQKNYPDRAAKVWSQISELHGGKVNDSTFGRRMRGEGPFSESIHQLFQASVKKYLSGRETPPYATHHFLRGGNYSLFGDSEQ